MSYPKVNRNGDEYIQHTLKEKYQFYTDIAEGKIKEGKHGKIGFSGRVAAANKANSILRKMGKNKSNYDYMQEQICGSPSKNK